MLEFLFGFGLGVFVGTKYNCKPYIDFVLHAVKNTLKDIKSDFKHANKLGADKLDSSIIIEALNNELKKEN